MKVLMMTALQMRNLVYISTLGGTSRAIFINDENESIDIGHVCDTALVPLGTVVKLKTNGEVTPVTAVTDQPYGVLSVGCKAIGDKVTVKTPFVAVVVGESSGTTAVNDDVAAQALNSGGTLMKYKTALETNWVIGKVLVGGANAAEIRVGIYRNPYNKNVYDSL